MTRNRGRIIRFIGFWSIFVIILVSLDKLMDSTIPHDTRVKHYWIMNHQGAEVDLAVSGSSKSYVAIDAGLLERLSGMKVINLSLEGASYAEQFLMLKMFLSKNRVKLLLLQTDAFALDDRRFSFPFKYYYFFPYLDDSEIFSFIREYCGAISYLWKYIPSLKYASYNQQVGMRQAIAYFTGVRPEQRLFDSWGSMMLEGRSRKTPFDGAENCSDPCVIEDRVVEYLRRILELCRSHGVKCLLFSTPRYSSRCPDDRPDTVDQYISFIANEYSVTYKKFDDEGSYEDQEYFFDRWHMNSRGAAVFTADLAQYLLRLFDQDRRTPQLQSSY